MSKHAGGLKKQCKGTIIGVILPRETVINFEHHVFDFELLIDVRTQATGRASNKEKYAMKSRHERILISMVNRWFNTVL